MRKILLSTIVLVAFALSITLFELSCKKTASAQPASYTLTPATTSKLGGVIPDGTTISVDVNGKISAVSNSVQQNKILYLVKGAKSTDNAIWTANYDGTAPQKINIALPANLTMDGHIAISPDHKTIFFSVFLEPAENVYTTYACNMDGSNLHVAVNGSSMGVAY